MKVEESNYLGWCFRLDPETRELKKERWDFKELLESQAQAAKEVPTAGTAILTDRDIRTLAGQYNPRNMSQEAYWNFIADLVHRGVLSDYEADDLEYLGRVVLRPGAYVQGRIETSRPLRTLADAGGDAIRWTRDKYLQQSGYTSKAAWYKAAAFRKVSHILERMAAQRQVV